MPNETIMVVEDSPTYLRQISDLLLFNCPLRFK